MYRYQVWNSAHSGSLNSPKLSLKVKLKHQAPREAQVLSNALGLARIYLPALAKRRSPIRGLSALALNASLTLSGSVLQKRTLIELGSY